MITTRLSLVLAASLLASTAVAQTATKPLNLDLSPSDVTPAAAGTSSSVLAPVAAGSARNRSALSPHVGDVDSTTRHAGVAASTHAQARPATPSRADAPGVYYGDHSADLGDDGVRPRVPPCDDYTYNQPQVHGSISTGIVSGNHIGTGSYSSGVVSVSKAFGSCEHPGGGISISVGGADNGGFGHHRWH